MRSELLAWAVVGVVGVVGCQDAPPTATLAPPTADAGKTLAPAVNVIVKGDGNSRGVALRGDAKVDLISVLPPPLDDRKSWVYLNATAADGRQYTIRNWQQGYGGFKAVLYLDAGRATLGIFKRAAVPGDAPKYVNVPRAKFGGVTEVEIRKTAPPSASVAPRSSAKTPLAVVIDGARKMINADDFHQIRSSEIDGRKGWLFSDVLAHLEVTGTPEKAVFRAGEEELSLTAEALPTAFFRRGGKGMLVVQFTVPTARRLRGVTAVEVTFSH